LPHDKSARGFDTAVQKDRRDDRLHRISQERLLPPPAGLLLAAAKQKVVANRESGRDARQRGRRDERGLGLRFLALAELRILPEQ
jgi:hypothetical protein